MKICKHLIFIIFFLIINSCKNYNHFVIRTKIFTDGSCERSLKTYYSKVSDFKKFPITVDTTWKVILEIDTIKKDEIDTFYIYSKYYPSIEKINIDYKDTICKYNAIEREIHVFKKFRFFHFLFQYNETYKKLFEGELLSSVLNEDEINIIRGEKVDSTLVFKGRDSIQLKQYKDSIETKYILWINRVLISNLYNEVDNEIKTSDKMLKYKEILTKNKNNYLNKIFFPEKELPEIINYIDSSCMANGELSEFLLRDSVLFNFKTKLKFWENIWYNSEITYELELPGTLVSDNADFIKDNILYYNVNWDKYFTEDYSMSAVSKTGIPGYYYMIYLVVLSGLGFLVIRILKK